MSFVLAQYEVSVNGCEPVVMTRFGLAYVISWDRADVESLPDKGKITKNRRKIAWRRIDGRRIGC